MENDQLEYVGFWPRVGASLIDTLLLAMIGLPLLTIHYGAAYWTSGRLVQGPFDLLISWILPAFAVILFWLFRQATPGKMAIAAKIVDAQTGHAPTTGQCIGRYFAYLVAGVPLGLGLVWVAIDDRKQGWHDKLAGTVVVRPKNRQPRPVSFDR